MKKIIWIILIFILTFSAFQYNQLQNDAVRVIKQRGFILIGTTGDYMPMSYFDKETQSYTGFDIASAEDLADVFHVKFCKKLFEMLRKVRKNADVFLK